jgi:hypothetical protein
MPTETYEHRRDVVPNVTIQRTRILPNDGGPGFVQHEYRDGQGRVTGHTTFKPRFTLDKSIKEMETAIARTCK